MTLFENLIEIVLSKSEEKTFFSIACTEWFLYRVEEERGKTCSCGKNPITECCYIKNKLNNNELLVGNECVKKFGKNVDWFFIQSKRIKKGLRPNKIMLDFLLGNFIINPEQHKFMVKLINKKKIKDSDKNKKDVILYKIQNKI